ncbi:hypothetical protein Y032_0002g859 [Ancylostoma ceylanicum]|uniref:Uncharacterized protein n=1 Tax=Ancylostoma ceylanicum TaxID=53326 RepID=A0A016W2S5_9BILA|nr:hypothetical protein Y032_0002g859 [Ancylostoma ceylanicum]
MKNLCRRCRRSGSTTACRRQRRRRRRSVASVDECGDGRSPVSTTAATAATHVSDAPPTINMHSGQCRSGAATETAILLEEYSGFGRRCRRHRRPTVSAVVDTPSSIPIDDNGDDYSDKVGFAFAKSF